MGGNIDFIFFSGQKRSGNHLLLNWLLSLYNNPYFINDIYPFDKPFDTNYVLNILKKIEYSKYDAVIVSFENLQVISDSDINQIINYGKSLNCKLYLPVLLRDPLNWYASYVAKLSNNLDKVWDLYLSGLKLWLKSDFPINFNIFIRSLYYRRELAFKLGKTLDLTKDKKVLNTLWKIPQVSIASSYDEENVKKGLQPKNMKVTERYKHFGVIKVPEEISKHTDKIWPKI